MLASFSNVANSAAIQGNQVFGPYGNARDSQGTINTAKGFTGQYNDSLTGLDYYGSRYYDQVAGVFLSADVKQGNMQGMNPYAYVGGNPETRNDPSGQRFVMPVGGGGSSSSSIIQAVNAVVPTSTAAQGGSQPCRDIGCASSVLARLEYLAAVHHVMNSNLAMLVCGEFCFTAVGEGQSSSTTYYRGETGIPETYCPPPFQCSVERAQNGGDTGVNGHDMPDVAAADTGGGAAGNPGEETSDSSNVNSGITSIGEGLLQRVRDKGVTVIQGDPEVNAYLARNDALGVTWFNGVEGEAGPHTTTVLLGENATDATVYEEWLHVLEGEKRGWLGLGSQEFINEEIMVKQQVLANADWLGMSQTQRENVLQWLQNQQ